MHSVSANSPKPQFQNQRFSMAPEITGSGVSQPRSEKERPSSLPSNTSREVGNRVSVMLREDAKHAKQTSPLSRNKPVIRSVSCDLSMDQLYDQILYQMGQALSMEFAKSFVNRRSSKIKAKPSLPQSPSSHDHLISRRPSMNQAYDHRLYQMGQALSMEFAQICQSSFSPTSNAFA